MRFTYALCLYGLLMIMGLFPSCKKSDSPEELRDRPAAITPVGTPIGPQTSKSIGTSGGSISSPDGRIELTFPAGALNANTTISIQPVTNTCPGGIGISYHLMPDGISFSKPVNLVYHYTKEEVNGSMPYLLYIAYQDNAMQWKADFKKRNVDTVAKTVTLGITHFSIWSMGDRLHLFCTPPDEEVHENETREFRAVLVDPAQPSANDDLPALPGETVLPANVVSRWRVNGITGNSSVGSITPNENKATYKAPSNIPQRRSVQVSVELNYTITVYNNGAAVSSVNQLILFKDLTLLPSTYKFKVNIHIKDKGVAGFIGQLYEDWATFDLELKKVPDPVQQYIYVATATNIVNYEPKVTPATQTYPTPAPGTFTWNWVPDPIGQTNITGVKVNSFIIGDTTINLEFLHTGTLSPGNTWSSTVPTLSGTVASQPFGGTAGLPSGVIVRLKEETQNSWPANDGGFMVVLVPIL
jgi:hypothetical protein